MAIGIEPSDVHPYLLEDSLPVDHVLKFIDDLRLGFEMGLGLAFAEVLQDPLEVWHYEGLELLCAEDIATVLL